LDLIQFIVLAYAALIGSTVFAPLVFGLFWRKATPAGGMASMLSGFGVCLIWYLIGQPFVDPVIPGIIVNVAVMLVVSKLTKTSDTDVLNTFFQPAHVSSKSLGYRIPCWASSRSALRRVGIGVCSWDGCGITCLIAEADVRISQITVPHDSRMISTAW